MIFGLRFFHGVGLACISSSLHLVLRDLFALARFMCLRDKLPSISLHSATYGGSGIVDFEPFRLLFSHLFAGFASPFGHPVSPFASSPPLIGLLEFFTGCWLLSSSLWMWIFDPLYDVVALPLQACLVGFLWNPFPHLVWSCNPPPSLLSAPPSFGISQLLGPRGFFRRFPVLLGDSRLPWWFLVSLGGSSFSCPWFLH